MPAKSWVKNLEAIQTEALKAWKWLIRLPEYRRDYAKFAAAQKLRERLSKRARRGSSLEQKLMEMIKRHGEMSQRFRVKWGFLPLSKPEFNGEIPVMFFAGFASHFGQNPVLLSGVHLRNINLWALCDLYERDQEGWIKTYCPKPPALPERLIFEIDPRRPLHLILACIKADMQEIQKSYGPKNQRPQQANLCLMYQAHVLQQLGRSPAEINKELFPGKVSDDSKESLRKRTYRYRKGATGHQSMT